MVMVMLSICDDNDDDNGHSMTVIQGQIYKRPAYIIHTIIQLEALITAVLSSEHVCYYPVVLYHSHNYFSYQILPC